MYFLYNIFPEVPEKTNPMRCEMGIQVVNTKDLSITSVQWDTN